MARGTTLTAAVAALGAAVAGAQSSWSVVGTQVGVGAAGVAPFDANTLIVAASDGFLGYNVYLSTDGGQSWVTAPTQNGYLPLLTDTSAYGGTIGIATGQSDVQTTWNKGAYFNTSVGGAGGVVSRVIAGSAGFALVGTFANGAAGVSISTDGGLTFGAGIAAGLQCDPSYGAFPSATTWYVTGGDAPASHDQTDQPTTTTGTPTTGTTTGTPTTGGTTTGLSGDHGGDRVYVHRITKRLSIVAPAHGRPRHVYEPPSPASFALRGRGLQASGYAAQIVKSSDGGNTWNSTFYVVGAYAMNGIDCLDVNTCCAVAEASSGTSVGAFIFCTTNGGGNWTTTYNSTTAGDSLIDIRAVGTSTYWAVGGNLGTSSISATWLKSTDAGATWTVDTTLPSYFGTGIECLAGTTSCWSTVVDVNDNSYIASNAA